MKVEGRKYVRSIQRWPIPHNCIASVQRHDCTFRFKTRTGCLHCRYQSPIDRTMESADFLGQLKSTCVVKSQIVHLTSRKGKIARYWWKTQEQRKRLVLGSKKNHVYLLCCSSMSPGLIAGRQLRYILLKQKKTSRHTQWKNVTSKARTSGRRFNQKRRLVTFNEIMSPVKQKHRDRAPSKCKGPSYPKSYPSKQCHALCIEHYGWNNNWVWKPTLVFFSFFCSKLHPKKKHQKKGVRVKQVSITATRRRQTGGDAFEINRKRVKKSTLTQIRRADSSRSTLD
jgi:hypothetical protein